MAKVANIYTRVDPQIKAQAEDVLDKLGISMATAMEIYLRQIAMQRKIPFEIALSESKPIAYGALSDDEFNALMSQAMRHYAEGKCTPLADFEKEIDGDYDA